MMNRKLNGALLVLLILSGGGARLCAQGGDANSRAVAAAKHFLSVLRDDQRAKAAISLDDPKKAAWHNGPPSMVPRPGVKIADLDPQQRDAARDVIKAVLSPYGFEKVNNIMIADEYFGQNMGASFATGSNAYSIAIYGNPSPAEKWMIQWNGHHLGLNVTIAGKNNTMAPSLTGAYPNFFTTKDGKKMRVLGDETDRAFKLMASLSEEQKSQAVLPSVVEDLVLGPGQDGKTIQPEGVKASSLKADQKAMLLSLASAWVDIMNEQSAKQKMADIKSHLNETYFAWSGDTKQGERAYFRVQGPTVFIEYAPQRNPGNGRGQGRGRGRGAATPPPGGTETPAASAAPPPAAPAAPPGQITFERDPNHVHTIYRDMTNEYGQNLKLR